MLSLLAYRDMVLHGERSHFAVPVLLTDLGMPVDMSGQFRTRSVAAQSAFLFDDELVRRSANANVFPIEKSGRNPYDAFVFVGRGATSDIVLRHHSVSKSHAYFAKTDAGWTLHDNRSRNGTFVDDRRIADQEPVKLAGRVLLTFGTLRTYFLDPKALAAMVL